MHMEQDLIKALRTVVKEEIEPVLNRLDRIELKFDNLTSEVRSGMRHLEDTIRDHRVVIDVLQRYSDDK
ncbi:hypothetical protein B4099_1017 [Heyndrickxia coagulans]|uniref:Uncharacterized protein n=2 Tax=Bacillaceae TaxID=186817 RepID=A0A150K586_HEYCO|nr:hypothetical protein B4099_1017 [Heyndrickxia coagulans]